MRAGGADPRKRRRGGRLLTSGLPDRVLPAHRKSGQGVRAPAGLASRWIASEGAAADDRQSDYPASWYAATRTRARRPPLGGHVQADVAVIGGGFAGLHAARLLAMRGRRVVLVEAPAYRLGASGRNGGFVSLGLPRARRRWSSAWASPMRASFYAQSKRGVAIVREAIQSFGRPDLLMGEGKLTVARTDQGAISPTASRAGRQLGADFEPWDTARVRASLVTERYHQAIHDAQSFHVHPLNLALALARDIERRINRLQASDAVRLERQGAAWCVHRRRRIAARHVVMAGNADLGRIQPRLARAILPVATYVAVTAKLGQSSPMRCGGPAPSPTRAVPATTIASSTATACCGVAASRPTRASRPTCAP